MARCDECKFWDIENGEKAGSFKVGRCQRAIQWWNATEWVDSDVEPEEWDNQRRLLHEHEGTKMFVKDASDYLARLYTAPDFFCAHFDQK